MARYHAMEVAAENRLSSGRKKPCLPCINIGESLGRHGRLMPRLANLSSVSPELLYLFDA